MKGWSVIDERSTLQQGWRLGRQGPIGIERTSRSISSDDGGRRTVQFDSEVTSYLTVRKNSAMVKTVTHKKETLKKGRDAHPPLLIS